MYDTVNFWIDRVDISGKNPFEILPYLSEVTERQNESSGYSCIGKVGDYQINIAENGISLKGSLPKNYFGNNIDTLTRRTSKQAIEQLSDSLHIDLSDARVTRIDVSTVIPTKRPPSDYYSYFGQKLYFERIQSTPNTLYYNNHQKQIIFYDKIKEAKSAGVSIPEVLKNNHLFRYELRYTKRLNKQLNAEVTASTLADEVFYRTIKWNWHNEFKTIQKLKTKDFMTENISTLKEAKDALIAYSLQQLGQDVVNDFLNELKSRKQLNNRSDYTKLKTELNRIISTPRGEQNDFLHELEKQIFTYAKYG